MVDITWYKHLWGMNIHLNSAIHSMHMKTTTQISYRPKTANKDEEETVKLKNVSSFK